VHHKNPVTKEIERVPSFFGREKTSSKMMRPLSEVRKKTKNKLKGKNKSNTRTNCQKSKTFLGSRAS